jgi:3-methyl-2-oxobutanoate hydroxymethyltransferase
MGLAKKITKDLSIPTIGIGAGRHCDGQVLVLHDVIGMFERFVPKFVKKYANLKDDALKAVQAYKEDIEKGMFPSEDQSFK